jgi:hypothetical protein
MVVTFVGPSTDRFLGIYINDHRAVSTAGIALARRCRRENQGTPFGEVLEVLIPDMEQDAATLNEVGDVLGVRTDPLKVGAAITGEFLGRFKLNGQLWGYSPLSRVVEIETLLACIEAERLLWNALQASHRPELDRFDFAALAQRAADHHDQLKPHHQLAAQLAFSASEHVGEVVSADEG